MFYPQYPDDVIYGQKIKLIKFAVKKTVSFFGVLCLCVLLTMLNDIHFYQNSLLVIHMQIKKDTPSIAFTLPTMMYSF